MLSGMTPEQFDEIDAMNRIVPFGDEKICWTLAKGFAALMNQIAMASGDANAKLVQPKKFIYWLDKKKRKKKPKYVSPNQAAAAFLMAVNRG